MCWKNADDPPKTKAGCWSGTVIVVTNHGRVAEISYYGNKNEGVWQRPAIFLQGEVVEKWIEK